MSWSTTAARIAAVTSRRLGNEVVIGSVSGGGILLLPSEEILDGAVVMTDTVVELPVELFGTILEGSWISVDGVDYVARQDGRLSADGATTVVPLRKIDDGEIPPPPDGSIGTVVFDGDFL